MRSAVGSGTAGVVVKVRSAFFAASAKPALTYTSPKKLLAATVTRVSLEPPTT